MRPFKWAAPAALFLLCIMIWLGVTKQHYCLMPGKENRLLCVISRHAGYAHMTRGMNTHTIAALDAATTEADIPILANILHGPDRVAAMTAARVLKTKGPQGTAALLQSFHAALNRKDTVFAMFINEHGDLRQKIYGTDRAQ